MIGKKSKFEQHERDKVQVQDNSNTTGNQSVGERKSTQTFSSLEAQDDLEQTTNGGEEPGGRDELSEQTLGSEAHQEEAQDNQEEVQLIEGNPTVVRSSGKYSPFTPDNKEDVRQEQPGTVSSDTSGTNTSSTIPGASAGVTILVPSNIKTDTELLWDEICNGVKGKNSGIPMGFNRLNKYLGLRKSIYTTIGAAAGCGKTSLVDCAYVLNPYDWYIKNKHKASTNVKFEVIYFSMERKKTYKLAKWLCMKIFKEENKLITTDELLSWQNTLDKRKQELAKFYIDNYFKEMTESGIVTIIDGQMNPTGIYKFMKANALKKGKEIQVNQFEERYVPNDDNLITNVVHDHAGKTKNENIGGKYDKKLSIDKASEYYCWARDYLGYSPIMINQFNRTSYQDIQFSKKEGGDPDPTVEYWKDSGNVIEDCDVAISLFNPYKYSLEEYMSYKVNDFTDTAGNNKFRGLKIIKNSYGTDNLRIGLGFLGEVSLFKELTKAHDISQKELNSVINNDFFLDF